MIFLFTDSADVSLCCFENLEHGPRIMPKMNAVDDVKELAGDANFEIDTENQVVWLCAGKENRCNVYGTLLYRVK